MPQDRLLFLASDVVWMNQGGCNGTAEIIDFTPDVETQKELEFVRTMWCNMCPVRTECLAYALLYRMSGYWGGTSTVERKLLGYARNRVRCPVCKNKALVTTTEGHEVCQGCAISWRAERPRLPEEAAG